MKEPLDTAILKRISDFDVPTISNAVEFFSVRPKTEGFMGPQIRAMLHPGRTVVGYAATARISATQPATEPQKSLLGQHYRSVRDTLKPTLAVIQDTDPQPVGSFWGEVHATVHKALGCVAAITNGGVRDLDEVRSLGFGYYATCTLVSHANVHLEEVGCPVTVGGLTVMPGDLLAADQHGVILIPNEIAAHLPDACEYAGKAEQPVLGPCREHLEAGQLVDPEDLVRWRAEMVRLRGSFPLPSG